MSAVNYLQFIDCTHDAVKQNEESQDIPPMQQEETYLGLPIYSPKNKPQKVTNSASIDVIFTGAWCSRMVTNY